MSKAFQCDACFTYLDEHANVNTYYGHIVQSMFDLEVRINTETSIGNTYDICKSCLAKVLNLVLIELEN
mgnify:CR=1 FL=1